MRQGESREEYRKRRKQADILDASKLGLPPYLPPISKDYLYRTVIAERLKQIFRVFATELEAKDLLTQISSGGVVLSGGGALTIGITEVAMKTLNVSARLGSPRALSGVVNDLDNPRYAVIVGLLEHVLGEGQSSALAAPVFEAASTSSFFGKLSDAWKKIMPA
jgi:cell division ATPase FtsA